MATTRPVRKVQVRVPTLSTVRPPRQDLSAGNVKLQDRAMSAQLQRSITDMQIDQTIDGASTLAMTVSDYTGAFMRSALLAGPVTATFDGMQWALVKIAKGDSSITLTFEERAVHLLRKYDSPRKANRANSTRAQFVRSLITEVTEAAIPYQIPEINQRQPIAK